MLTLNIDSLDADIKIIVQSVRYQTLERQKDQLAAVQDEDAAEAYADEEVEAAYAAATTPPCSRSRMPVQRG